MNHSFGKLSALICLTGIALMAPQMAHATWLCSSSNNPIAGSTVSGNLEVKAGNSCDLNAVTVNGNVLADPTSSLTLEGGTVINGNLSSKTVGVQISSSHISHHGLTRSGGQAFAGS